MSCNSRIDELLRYRKSRLPAGVYLPLALFLCTASLAAGWPNSIGDFAINFLLAYTFVFQFRLWDDLCDISRDRFAHPERVMSQATSLVHFRILLVALFVFNLLMVTFLKGDFRGTAFTLLNAAFFVTYRALGKLRLGAIPSCHVVLIKYPAFVYLLSPEALTSDSVSLAYAMILVYLCFCVHEVLHDARLRMAQGAICWLASEMLALALVALLMFLDLARLGGPAAALQGAWAILGSLALLHLFQRCRTNIAPGIWRYAVFLIGFSWLLNYSLVAVARSDLDRLAR